MALRLQKEIRVVVMSNRPECVADVREASSQDAEIRIAGTVGRVDRIMECVQGSGAHIVLVDDSMAGATPSAITQQVVTALPAVAVVVLTASHAVEEVRRSMLAGARGFLMQPYGPAELAGTIRQVYEVECARQATATSPRAQLLPSRRGQIITVAGLKGGAGRTVLAGNLAIALQMTTGEIEPRVAIVDGHLGAGDMANMLNVQPLHTLADFLARGGELDRDVMEAILTPHTSGVQLLVPSTPFNGLEVIEPHHIEQMLSQLQQMFSFVIVDTGPALDRSTLVMLDMADMLLIVTTPEIPALLRTSLFLDSARSWGYPNDKLRLVLNRANCKGGIPTDEVESHLRVKITTAIPDDAPLVTYSVNRGVPIMIGHRQSSIAATVMELAERLSGYDASHRLSNRAGSLMGRLAAIRLPGSSADSIGVRASRMAEIVGLSSGK